MEIAGSVLGTAVTVVIPILFFNKAYEEKTEGKKYWIRKINYGVFVFGCGIGLLGLVGTIQNM